MLHNASDERTEGGTEPMRVSVGSRKIRPKALSRKDEKMKDEKRGEAKRLVNRQRVHHGFASSFSLLVIPSSFGEARSVVFAFTFPPPVWGFFRANFP